MKQAILGILMILMMYGCASTATYELAAPGAIPNNMPPVNVRESRHYNQLMKTLKTGGTEHERVKIQYLIDRTRESGYRFDRNGLTYDARKTSDHLIKKYRQRYDKILTAHEFIEHVASISTASDRAYYALPGDGMAYQAGDLLHHELNRLEEFLKEQNTQN